MKRVFYFLFICFSLLNSKELERVYINPPKIFDIPKIESDLLQKYSFSGTGLSLKPFYISKYEITKQEYLDYLKKVKKNSELKKLNYLNNDSYEDEENEPQVNINFYEAQDFCRYNKGRLPSELEWIVASSFKVSKSRCFQELRKGIFYKYAIAEYPLKSDSNITECFLKNDDEFDYEIVGNELNDVKYSLENINGTYGMFGNVWEWVDSDREYFNKKYKVIKGGSFENYGFVNLFDNRVSNFLLPETKKISVGFRCVWDK